MQDRDLDGWLDLTALAGTLELAGWDVIASPELGEVAARLEHPPAWGVWTLVIDRSGRVRFKVVRETRIAEGRSFWRGQRRYRLLKEGQEVLTLTSELSTEQELPELLRELAAVILAEDGPVRGKGNPWEEPRGEQEANSSL